MVTVLTLLTQLMIYNKKYNLNNLNFLLSGKDIKYKPKKPITRLRPTRLHQEKIYQHFCSIWQHIAAKCAFRAL